MIEQDIQSLIMIEISKLGGIPIRLNSGKAWGGVMSNGVIIHPRAIKLCPEGTPDILAILPNGRVAWVECKTAKGRQRESQKRFQIMLEKLGHKYYLLRTPKDVHLIFE